MGESEWIISKQLFFLSQSYSYNICDWMKKLWKMKSHILLLYIYLMCTYILLYLRTEEMIALGWDYYIYKF